MISKNTFTDILSMITLICLQVFVMSRIQLLDLYTPTIYPVFVMFYPFFKNQYQYLFFSFLIGLGVDAFLGTWGINAMATVTIAYFRTLIFRSSTNSNTDFFSFSSIQWTQFLFFIFSSIFIHQLIVQVLEFFKWDGILDVLYHVLISSVISFIFIVIYAFAFKIKERV